MMRNLFLAAALGVGGVVVSSAGPDPLYENYGNTAIDEFDIQIDAIAFANYGTFTVTSSVVPYDFQNTLYFTNRGTMQSPLGFRFDTAYSDQPRKPAEVFINERRGQITVQTWLSVDADKIEHQGLMSVASDGLLSLQGMDLDLARGGLESRAVLAGSDNLIPTNNFIPAPGIVPLYWGGYSNDPPVINSAGILDLSPGQATNASSPFHIVTNYPSLFPGGAFVNVSSPQVGVYTNMVDETNIVTQVAFVQTIDTNLTAQIAFATPPNGGFGNIGVSIAMSETNVVTGLVSQQAIYFQDSLATTAETNRLFDANLVYAAAYRPSVYRVSRAPLPAFLQGGPGNANIAEDTLYNPEFASPFVTNVFAAYAVELPTGASQIPAVPGASITNATGRIQIIAENLDMTETLIRGNSVLTIQADNLISSDLAVVDAPFLQYDLGAKDGHLAVRNLAKKEVARLNGPLQAYSALWTNTLPVITETPPENPEDPPTLSTNNVNYAFHVLIIQAGTVVSRTPVLTDSLKLSGTNVVVDDQFTILGGFEMLGDNFTLNGGITLGGIPEFGATNAPNMINFTNNGLLSVQNVARFGVDREPYQSMVINGTNLASAMLIASDYFQNSGSIRSQGRLELTAQTAKMEDGFNQNGRDVLFSVEDLKFHNYRNESGGRIYLDIANSLSDSGGDAGVSWVCSDGFQMLTKPTYGDLLGTTISTIAPQRTFVDHIWPGQDLGAVREGFVDNAAIGRLVLNVSTGGKLFFVAPTEANAIYVDMLELEGLVLNAYNNGNLESVMEIDPGMTIYFGGSNVLPEDLDGMLDGRLVWVMDFAGPHSGTALTLPSGTTIWVNRGELESLTLDKDGDGIPNGRDLTPWPEPSLAADFTDGAPSVAHLSWWAAPEMTYTVEYTSDLLAGDWQVLGSVTNADLQAKELTVDHELGPDSPHLYYRVSYAP